MGVFTSEKEPHVCRCSIVRHGTGWMHGRPSMGPTHVACRTKSLSLSLVLSFASRGSRFPTLFPSSLGGPYCLSTLTSGTRRPFPSVRAIHGKSADMASPFVVHNSTCHVHPFASIPSAVKDFLSIGNEDPNPSDRGPFSSFLLLGHRCWQLTSHTHIECRLEGGHVWAVRRGAREGAKRCSPRPPVET